MGPPVSAFYCSIFVFLALGSYPQHPQSAGLVSKSEWVTIQGKVWVGSVGPMIEAFIEFSLSFFLVWLGFVACYSLYSWHNSSKRVIRRKLIEAGL